MASSKFIPVTTVRSKQRFTLGETVPAEIEYEEAPRGRVMYNTKTGQFTLLADRCILLRKELVVKIKSELHLPANIKLGTDSHHRCFTCLYGKDDEVEHIYHRAFAGSYSVKGVLPALVPEMSYKGVTVADGQDGD